jgi:diguanylate cyclase (GGDEF)-like protein
VLLTNLLALKTTLDIKRVCALERENITDPLLGIFNRRHLEVLLRQEFLLCRREALPLSLLLIDIDHFKEINDSYGHLAGDKALIGLVRVIKGQLRQTDQLARYGGEEIMVMLPHTPEAAALKLAWQRRSTRKRNCLPGPINRQASRPQPLRRGGRKPVADPVPGLHRKTAPVKGKTG